MLVLPREEYDWFDIQSRSPQATGAGGSPERDVEALGPAEESGVPEPSAGGSNQRQFFDYAGPLHSVVISPTSSTLAVGQTRRLRALPRDRSRRRVEQDLTFAWEIVDGGGTLLSTSDQEVSFEELLGVARSRAFIRRRLTARACAAARRL